VEKAFVVHGHDGMDEMTTTDLTRVTELNDDVIKTYDVDPLTYFDEYADPKDLLGGDAKHNAAITRAILSGGKGPKQNIVLLNAGAGLVAADAAPTIEKGIEMALRSIETGAAMEKLELLADYTRENA
jgi:anthranilate phosphoribosyltransferase